MAGFLLLLQFLCFAIATVASVAVAIIVSATWPNFIYPITKRGREPYKRPPSLWVIFWLTLATAVCSGSVATILPSVSDRFENNSIPIVNVPITVIPPSQTAIKNPIEATELAQNFPIGQDVFMTSRPAVSMVSSPVFLKDFGNTDGGAYALLFPPSCLITKSGLKIEPIDNIEVGLVTIMPKPNPSKFEAAYIKLEKFTRYEDAYDTDNMKNVPFQIGQPILFEERYWARLYEGPFEDNRVEVGFYKLPKVTIQPFTVREWIINGQDIDLTPNPQTDLIYFFTPIRLETPGAYGFNIIFQVRSMDGTIYLVGSYATLYFGTSLKQPQRLGKVIEGLDYNFLEQGSETLGLSPCE